MKPCNYLQVNTVIIAFFVSIDAIIALHHFIGQKYYCIGLPIISGLLLLLSLTGLNLLCNEGV